MQRFLPWSDNLTTSWKHNCSCHKRAQCIYLQCRQSYSVYLAETVLLQQKQSPAHSVSLLYRTTRLLPVLKQSTAAPDCHVIRSQPIQTNKESPLGFRSMYRMFKLHMCCTLLYCLIQYGQSASDTILL